NVPENFVMAESIRPTGKVPVEQPDGAPIAVPPRSPPAPIEPLKCDLRNIDDLPFAPHRQGAPPPPVARSPRNQLLRSRTAQSGHTSGTVRRNTRHTLILRRCTVTVSLRKMSPGHGCNYLLKSV